MRKVDRVIGKCFTGASSSSSILSLPGGTQGFGDPSPLALVDSHLVGLLLTLSWDMLMKLTITSQEWSDLSK